MIQQLTSQNKACYSSRRNDILSHLVLGGVQLGGAGNIIWSDTIQLTGNSLDSSAITTCAIFRPGATSIWTSSFFQYCLPPGISEWVYPCYLMICSCNYRFVPLKPNPNPDNFYHCPPSKQCHSSSSFQLTVAAFPSTTNPSIHPLCRSHW